MGGEDKVGLAFYRSLNPVGAVGQTYKQKYNSSQDHIFRSLVFDPPRREKSCNKTEKETTVRKNSWFDKS